MSIQEIFAPVEITYKQRVCMMLQDIEDEGFHLYYDEKTGEWECMNENSELSVCGQDKFQVICDSWRQIMLG